MELLSRSRIKPDGVHQPSLKAEGVFAKFTPSKLTPKKDHPKVVFELFNLAEVEVVSELVLQTHFG